MWSVLPWLVGFAVLCTETTAGEIPAKADAWIESQVSDLVDLYRHLHRNPELSYREVNTARRLAEELREAGAQVTTGVGGQGVVGVLKNGVGPTVLVRTDMDALPVTETTGLPYASSVTDLDDQGNRVGVMHACGHDLHMAVFVGTARWLHAHRSCWSGTVVMVGQPAEEQGGGAEAMLDDGLYRRFPKPDFALALHAASDLEAGKIGYRSGPVMAGSTSIEITLRGRGGQGPMRNRTIEPVVLASALVLDFQSIVGQEVDPVEPVVVSVGAIHSGPRFSGTKFNVVSDEVKLRLSIRAFRRDVRDQLIAAIRRRAKAMADVHGAMSPEVKVVGGGAPTVNTPALVSRVVPSFIKAMGQERVSEVPPKMISEDFGLYSEGGVPTFMFFLGTIGPERLTEAKDRGELLPSLHSPTYYCDVPDSLRGGIMAMTAAVANLLPPTTSPPLPGRDARPIGGNLQK